MMDSKSPAAQTPNTRAPEDISVTTNLKNQNANGSERRKNKIKWVIASAVGLIVAIGSISYYVESLRYETTDDAFVEGDIIAMSAKVPGRIAEILVQDNQEVKAGQLLARIEPEDYRVRLEQAQAALDAAQARLSVAKTNIDLIQVNTNAALLDARAGVEEANAGFLTSESRLASAKSEVAAARAEYIRRKADLERYKALDPRAVTQQQIELAQANFDTAAARLEAVEKEVTAAESRVAEARANIARKKAAVVAAETAPQQIAVAEAQAKSAQAEVQRADAAVQSAKLDYSYIDIKAPRDGHIARKNIQIGQYFQVGQPMLMIVPSDVWVVANFKETQLKHMLAGQRVDINVDAFPGRHFEGTVESFQKGTGARFSLLPPENATGNYVKIVQRVPVKILLSRADESTRLLAPGMSVIPRVHIARSTEESNQATAKASR